MKTINSVLIVLSINLFFCCNKESDKNELDEKNEPIEIRSNFSETEFKNALIGEWRSVFENTEYENVIYLKFDSEGKSSIKTKMDNFVYECSGDYIVSFIREPAEGYITLAKISISCSNKEIELSRVYFGLHNAFPVDSGLFLRIEEPPYGVLDRID
jgi:hypothetical protein